MSKKIRYIISCFTGIDFNGNEYVINENIRFVKFQTNSSGHINHFENAYMQVIEVLTFIEIKTNDEDIALKRKEGKYKSEELFLRFEYIEPVYSLIRLLSELDFAYHMQFMFLSENNISYSYQEQKLPPLLNSAFIPHIVTKSNLCITEYFRVIFNKYWDNFINNYNNYEDSIAYFNHSIIDNDADYSRVFIFIALETILLRHDDTSISRKFNNRINGFYENLGKSKPLDETVMKDIYGSLRSPQIHSSIRQDTITNETIKYQQLFRDIMILMIENNIELPKEYSCDNPSHDRFLRKIYNEIGDNFQKELFELKNPKIRVAEVFIDKLIRKKSYKVLKEKDVKWEQYVSNIVEVALNKVINENDIFN